VLTDIVMPEMNGLDLGRLLQTQWPHLKLLYTSGYPEVDMERYGGVEEGVRPLIEKPFHFDELVSRVRELVHEGS
jgi:DNA-binding response OmpR family regulator